MKDLKNDGYLKFQEADLDFKLSYDSEYVDYTNMNPKGVITGCDNTFQILSIMMPDKSAKEIADILLNEQLSTGHMVIDQSVTEKLLRTYFDISEINDAKSLTVSEFLSRWNELLPKNRLIVLKLRGRHVIFDTSQGKFRTCTPISMGSRVFRAYICDRKII